MKTLLTFLLIIIGLNVKGQIIVYETAEDFNNKTGIEYDAISEVFSPSRIIFKKGNKKKTFKCKNSWGFTYDNILFRTANLPQLPSTFAILLVNGEGSGPLYYYEYGGPYLAQLMGSESYYVYSYGDVFVSSSIDGELAFTLGYMGSRADLKKFCKNNPRLESFCDCVINTESHASECVITFYREKGIDVVLPE